MEWKRWPKITRQSGLEAGLQNDMPFRRTHFGGPYNLRLFSCLHLLIYKMGHNNILKSPKIKTSYIQANNPVLFPVTSSSYVGSQSLFSDRVQRHGYNLLSQKENKKSSWTEACIHKTLDWLHDFLICVFIYIFDMRQFTKKNACDRNRNPRQEKRRLQIGQS